MTAIVGIRQTDRVWLACDSAMTDADGGKVPGQKWLRVGGVILALAGDQGDCLRIASKLARSRGPRTGTLRGWLTGWWKVLRVTDGVAIGPGLQLCVWDSTNAPADVDFGFAGSGGESAMAAALALSERAHGDILAWELQAALASVAKVRTDVAGPYPVHSINKTGAITRWPD